MVGIRLPLVIHPIGATYGEREFQVRERKPRLGDKQAHLAGVVVAFVSVAPRARGMPRS